MSDVVSFKPLEGVPLEIQLGARDRIIQTVADALQSFERDTGRLATGIVFIITDDQGASKLSWDTTQSALPPNAILGMATRHLVTNSLSTLNGVQA